MPYYYPAYPSSSYYPDYSSDPCYPYGPYDCRISGYGPAAAAADPPADPDPANYSRPSAAPAGLNAYVGDGQWHRFGAQTAPVVRAASPPSAAPPSIGEPARHDNAFVGDGQWHHFGAQTVPSNSADSYQAARDVGENKPAGAYSAILGKSR